MSRQTQTDPNDLGNITEDARTLMNATAEVSGDKIGEARKRLAAALDSAGKMLNRAKEKAVVGAKATDKVIHENPYQAIFIALGVGLLIGYLSGRRHSRNDD
jgi:ElaB/YqjD/DUF883 family membrane-anchored ribosome-binding protein